MGVRAYHNKWRGAASLHGKNLQYYFDSEEAAKRFVRECKLSDSINKPVWAKRNTKRINAKHQDLPIGFFQTYEEKENDLGIVAVYQQVKCVFKLNGKNKTISRNFGRRKSREEAITDLISTVTNHLNKEANNA